MMMQGARDELLAATGFASDQHGSVGTGDTFDHLHEAAHRFAADDCIESFDLVLRCAVLTQTQAPFRAWSRFETQNTDSLRRRASGLPEWPKCPLSVAHCLA